MSTDRWLGRVEDIREAIDDIQGFIAGVSPEQFAADSRTMSAVACKFLIIGEATRHIPPDVRSRYPSVPWAKMAAMRNVVAHGRHLLGNRSPRSPAAQSFAANDS